MNTCAMHPGLKKVEAELLQVRTELLLVQPLIGRLLARLDLIATDHPGCRTACTDGRRIFVDVDFWRSLKPAHQRFLLAHEVWHCALGHLGRRLHRESERWNVAIDHVVNALLVEQDRALPPGAVFINEPWAENANAETVYEHLVSSSCPLRGWGDMHMEASAADGDEGEGFAPCLDPGIGDYWRGILLVEAARLERQGRLPAGISRLVEPLRHPVIPWPRVLARFLTIHARSGGRYRWLPPARRHLHAGLYLPRRTGERLDAAVLIDSSGSTQHLLPRFLAELRGIIASADHWSIRVLICDAAVHRDVTFDTSRPLPDRMDIPGGGGSDFCPAFERLRAEGWRHPVVALTDGYISVPKEAPRVPVMWVVPEGCKVPAGWGKAVLM